MNRAIMLGRGHWSAPEVRATVTYHVFRNDLSAQTALRCAGIARQCGDVAVMTDWRDSRGSLISAVQAAASLSHLSGDG